MNSNWSYMYLLDTMQFIILLLGNYSDGLCTLPVLGSSGNEQWKYIVVMIIFIR